MTIAATTPNTNCETMNQGQLTRPCKQRVDDSHQAVTGRRPKQRHEDSPHTKGPGIGRSLGSNKPYTRPRINDKTTWITTAVPSQSALNCINCLDRQTVHSLANHACEQIGGIPKSVTRREAPDHGGNWHEQTAEQAAQHAPHAGPKAASNTHHDRAADNSENKLRRNEPGPVDTVVEGRIDDRHREIARRRPKQRHQGAAPGKGFRNLRQRRQQDTVQQSQDGRHSNVRKGPHEKRER